MTEAQRQENRKGGHFSPAISPFFGHPMMDSQDERSFKLQEKLVDT